MFFLYLVLFLIRLIHIYMWILTIYALLSWFPQIATSSFGRFIRRIVEPYLCLFDRVPTRFGVFDFKIALGIVALMIIERFLGLFLG